MKKIPTYLRPHEGVRCPNIPEDLLEQGYILSVSECEKCGCALEIKSMWRGYKVKCALEGESDNVTVEYG